MRRYCLYVKDPYSFYIKNNKHLQNLFYFLNLYVELSGVWIHQKEMEEMFES